MSYHVRVRLLRGTLEEFTIAESRSSSRIHRQADNLRDVLRGAFNGELSFDHYLEIRVVKVRPKRCGDRHPRLKRTRCKKRPNHRGLHRCPWPPKKDTATDVIWPWRVR